MPATVSTHSCNECGMPRSLVSESFADFQQPCARRHLFGLHSCHMYRDKGGGIGWDADSGSDVRITVNRLWRGGDGQFGSIMGGLPNRGRRQKQRQHSVHFLSRPSLGQG